MKRLCAGELIERRKREWEKGHDLERDLCLREAIGREIVENQELLEEVRERPERLVELVFVITDKEKHTVPFFLNEVQMDFAERLARAKRDFSDGKIPGISILILKGRQQGFTSFITAYQLAMTVTHKNMEGYTVADSAANAQAIFENKAKYPYERLPVLLKPTEKYNNRRELRFSRLGSSWSVDPATKNMGRSRTVNFFHGSECAFWPSGIAGVQAGMGEALTRDSIKIYESTANGWGDYREMWASGAHICCFYEWWRTKEYRAAFQSVEERDAFVRRAEEAGESDLWIWRRIRWLMQEKRLTPEQCLWYKQKHDGYLAPELIRQEYPCTAEEAFLTSGRCIFDTEAIAQQMDRARAQTGRRGDFVYTRTGDRIEEIGFVESRSGAVVLYREPEPGRAYTLGGDTAGDGSDWFAGQVLLEDTGEQAAVLHQKYDEDRYAEQMYCLGKYYGWALAAVEVNFSTHPIKELQRLGYPNLYFRRSLDGITEKMQMKYGWRTDRVSRPQMLAELVRQARENPGALHDPDTLGEMLVFVKNERGRPEAMAGEHDDLVISLAIANAVRGCGQTAEIEEPDGGYEQEIGSFLNFG